MNCQDSLRKAVKCSCDRCIREQYARIKKDNCSERISHHKTNENYYKNYAVPDDQYYSKGNFSSVKPSNRKAGIDASTIQALASLRQRACRLLETSDGTVPSEEEAEEEEDQVRHQEPSQSYRPSTHSKSKPRTNTPATIIRNLDYSPQSNFLRKMRKFEELNPGNFNEPLIQPGCANCVPGGDPCRTQIKCPHCRRCPTDHAMQNLRNERPHIRERNGPCSDLSSVHDPCTCFQTWRPNACGGYFPEYQHEILKGDIGTCAGEAYAQECLNNVDDECENRTPYKKKGKPGHVSRLDKTRRRRRIGRRKSKPNEEVSPVSRKESPEIDFSPSLKRPHPNSCERCWRYASPSRSPVNRPSQRFDPNYRRSHSQVNINSDSRGNISKRGSDDSGSNYSKSAPSSNFDPETKVHELASSHYFSKRVKSPENVQKSNLLRPATATSLKKTHTMKEYTGKSKINKEESDVGGTQKSKNKSQKSCVNFSVKNTDIAPNYRPGPMQCSPSMFDKKSQRSDSKNSACNRLSSPEPGKEKANIKPRPLSASQTQSSMYYFDKPKVQTFNRNPNSLKENSTTQPRAKSFDRNPNCVKENFTARPRAKSFDRNQNCVKENFSVPPERMGKCCCMKRRPQTVNMNLVYDQPHFYQDKKNKFLDARDSLEISNYQENPRRLDNPCPGLEGTRSFGDIQSCICSYKAMPESKFRGLANSCCQKVPVTIWDRKNVWKEETGMCKLAEAKTKNRYRNDEENNPRKYCVFYMNRSKENEKDDDVEVLIEELTEGRNGRSSQKDSLKSKTRKMQEQRLDSMALKFQKGIPERCKRLGSDRFLYF